MNWICLKMGAVGNADSDSLVFINCRNVLKRRTLHMVIV